MATGGSQIIANGEIAPSSKSPAPQKQPTLEEAAAAQMAQLDLEGNKLPSPASSATVTSKTNGSSRVGPPAKTSRNGVRDSSGNRANSSTGAATTTPTSRPTTRSLSTSSNGAAGRATSSTRSASSSRKSSQQSMSPTTATTPEIKKVPMNKIVVGTTPSPNVAKVSSKIGSLQNTTYKPTGGNVKIENKKLSWKAESKIGSMANVKHVPGGGNVKIEEQKIQIKVQSKVGSMQNMKHRPGGGDKKIFDDKEYLKQQKQVGAAGSSKGGSKSSSMKGSVENLVE